MGGYLAINRPPVDSDARTTRSSISPPNGYALEAGSSRQTFALSPDGTLLAFSAMDASGAFQTFIRDLDALESRPLANSIGSYTLFWAPDGRSLFTTIDGSVRRTALDDDSYQVVCDTPALTLTGAVLGPNLLISARSANFVVPVSGGTPRATERAVSMAPGSAGWEAHPVSRYSIRDWGATARASSRSASPTQPKISWKPTRELRTPRRCSSPKPATCCL